MTLDSVYELVMQLRGTWDSPPLKAFSQYPSFPLLRAISVTVCPLQRHPPCAASLLPPQKIPHTPKPLAQILPRRGDLLRRGDLSHRHLSAHHSSSEQAGQDRLLTSV